MQSANKVIFPWSFSALDAYELCPKKFYHEKIAKDFKQKSNEVQHYGIAAHKFFEDYLIKDTRLPLDLRHHQPVLDRFKSMSGEHLPEQKLAINKDFMPTGFFDSDVYCRSVIDFGVLNIYKSHMVIVDWKFGRPKDDFDQVKLMIAVMSCYEPDIENFVGMYYWAKEKRFTSIKVNKKDIPAIWAEILPRVQVLEDAVLSSEFPAIKNFLCSKYCPVTICVHNGEH